jgi:hypothetical protein
MMMYVQDYDEHFPSQDPDPSRPQLMDDLWLFVIVPYIKTPPADWASTRSNIYVCPSNPNLQLVSDSVVQQALQFWGWDLAQRVPPDPAHPTADGSGTAAMRLTTPSLAKRVSASPR